MAHLRIEMDRGNGWELRSEGLCDANVTRIKLALAAYGVQHVHRALMDGVEVARVVPRMPRARAALWVVGV